MTRSPNSVVIITGHGPSHKYFCLELARRQNVLAILQPTESRPVGAGRFTRLERVIGHLRRLRSRSRRLGVLASGLHYITHTELGLVGWNRTKAMRASERCYFDGIDDQFKKELSFVARTVGDINSPQSISLISEIDPAAVICFGGPIYRKPLIDSCRLMLNFHTGISPLYNGTGSIFWTFANGHIHLSGATLMTMVPAVDGGDILAHYFPEIESDDNPATLYAKCVKGAVTVYDRFLSSFWKTGSFTRIKQPKPFFFYHGYDWNATQTLAIDRTIRAGLVGQYSRGERIVEYWALRDEQEARHRLHAELIDLICRY